MNLTKKLDDKMNLPKYWYTTFLNTSLLKVSSNETEIKKLLKKLLMKL